IRAGVGEVLDVGGDVGRHGDVTVGDELDEVVLVADAWKPDLSQVVGHRVDDVTSDAAGRAEPEERGDDRVPDVRVCGVEALDDLRGVQLTAHRTIPLVELDAALRCCRSEWAWRLPIRPCSIAAVDTEQRCPNQYGRAGEPASLSHHDNRPLS